MTTISELHDILIDEFKTNTQLTKDQSYEVLEVINQSESLGDMFRTLLQVLNGPVDVTDPKLKNLLRENEPILLLIKKINRRGHYSVNLQREYDNAVEFFNSRKVIS